MGLEKVSSPPKWSAANCLFLHGAPVKTYVRAGIKRLEFEFGTP
jgi:hypothetical protein